MSNSTYCEDHYEQPDWMKKIQVLEKQNKELRELLAKKGKEPVSEDLYEAAEDYAATGEILPNGKEIISFDALKSFKAGAQWQKMQMMKDAVECSIILSDKYYFIEDEEECSEIIEALGCKHGDKVKLIIIKED